MATVKVVKKIGCPRCMLLEDKLELLGVKYEEAGESALEDVTNKDAVAGMQFPITIIDGVAYEYSQATKKLKEMRDAG